MTKFSIEADRYNATQDHGIIIIHATDNMGRNVRDLVDRLVQDGCEVHSERSGLRERRYEIKAPRPVFDRYCDGMARYLIEIAKENPTESDN